MSGILSTAELIITLQSLPKGTRVVCNSLENLTVLSSEDKYLGYVDFLTGSMEFPDDDS